MPAITKLVSSLPEGSWIRICQECGYHQQDREPDTRRELTSAYRNRACKACRSEALDYGTTNGSYDWTEDEII